MFLTAEFLEPEPVVAGVGGLVSAGFSTKDIEIFSDRPMELPKGLLERRSWISVAAVSGAIINSGIATAFMHYTQREYALNTGGMPTVSWWATGVISFEMIMAGAVAGAVLAFLWESRLLRWRRVRPPSPWKEGSIFVQVQCSKELAAAAAACLTQAGAAGLIRQDVG